MKSLERLVVNGYINKVGILFLYFYFSFYQIKKLFILNNIQMSKIYLVKLESTNEFSLYESHKEQKIGSSISIGTGFFKIISEIEIDVHGRYIKLEPTHFRK